MTDTDFSPEHGAEQPRGLYDHLTDIDYSRVICEGLILRYVESPSDENKTSFARATEDHFSKLTEAIEFIVEDEELPLEDKVNCILDVLMRDDNMRVAFLNQVTHENDTSDSGFKTIYDESDKEDIQEVLTAADNGVEIVQTIMLQHLKYFNGDLSRFQTHPELVKQVEDYKNYQATVQKIKSFAGSIATATLGAGIALYIARKFPR